MYLRLLFIAFIFDSLYFMVNRFLVILVRFLDVYFFDLDSLFVVFSIRELLLRKVYFFFRLFHWYQEGLIPNTEEISLGLSWVGCRNVESQNDEPKTIDDHIKTMFHYQRLDKLYHEINLDQYQTLLNNVDTDILILFTIPTFYYPIYITVSRNFSIIFCPIGETNKEHWIS